VRSVQLPEFTRRVFLTQALQALGAAAALPLPALARQMGGGAEAGTAPAHPAGEMPPLEYLTQPEYVALDAIGDTLIPHGGAFALGAREAGLTRRIDHYLTKFDPAVATGFRGAIAFVEQQAPPLAGKTAPFSALSEADRTAVLEAMLKAGGVPASVLLATKYVCISHFYTMDRTWQFTGYDGPMLLEGSR
jgi:hypothetical protein